MNGIDIYHGQGDNGLKLSKIEYDFAIVKTSQATSFKDGYADIFAKEVVSAKKKLGLYHYFGGCDPVKEAEYFLKIAKDYIGRAILILDWESYQNRLFSTGEKTALQFLEYVEKVTGVTPFIYMSKSVCREYSWKNTAGRFPLWVAQYADKNVVSGYKKSPWTDNKGMGAFESAAIFQYTSTGRLSGYSGDLDLDCCYLSPAEWDEYATGKNLTGECNVNFYEVPEFTLIENLKKIGVDSSFENRKKIAAANGIKNYGGTKEENIQLLSLLTSGKLRR